MGVSTEHTQAEASPTAEYYCFRLLGDVFALPTQYVRFVYRCSDELDLIEPNVTDFKKGYLGTALLDGSTVHLLSTGKLLGYQTANDESHDLSIEDNLVLIDYAGKRFAFSIKDSLGLQKIDTLPPLPNVYTQDALRY